MTSQLRSTTPMTSPLWNLQSATGHAAETAELPEKAPVTVVIPTYRRPAALTDCVRSLLEGTLRPAEIIVVGRHGDTETEQALAGLDSGFGSTVNFQSAWVTEAGHIPPVEMGIQLARNRIVAILDDDVTVARDWLAHILSPFSDFTIGVVGGRVVVPGSQPVKLRGKPGRSSWYGKHWGNVAHMAGEAPVEVESVMECNWAWRRDVASSLRFDAALNFDDATMYGLDLCVQARRKGLRVVYEPRALVYHHVARRAAELDRGDRPRRDFAYCRNYTYIMLKNLSWPRRLVFLAWWFLVGERGGWGIGAWAADALGGGRRESLDVVPALRGKIEGIRLWLRQ